MTLSKQERVERQVATQLSDLFQGRPETVADLFDLCVLAGRHVVVEEPYVPYELGGVS